MVINIKRLYQDSMKGEFRKTKEKQNVGFKKNDF